MIKDFSISKQIEKHARHVESAHRELSIHAKRLQEKPTVHELHRLLQFTLRPRLSRSQEVRGCKRRGPEFKRQYPEHHEACRQSEHSLDGLITVAESILANYVKPESHEYDHAKTLSEADQGMILQALKMEMEQ